MTISSSSYTLWAAAAALTSGTFFSSSEIFFTLFTFSSSGCYEPPPYPICLLSRLWLFKGGLLCLDLLSFLFYWLLLNGGTSIFAWLVRSYLVVWGWACPLQSEILARDFGSFSLEPRKLTIFTGGSYYGGSWGVGGLWWLRLESSRPFEMIWL